MATGWLYRQPVTVNSIKVPSSQVGVTITEDLANAGAAFFSHVALDGRDIRNYEPDGVTPIPREVETINTGAQTGIVHFKGDVSSASDVTFYREYGNPLATEPSIGSPYGAENVYDSNYKMNLNLTGLLDSTSNDNDATAFGAAAPTTGKIGGAYNFGGVIADYVTANGVVSGGLFTAPNTVEIWGRLASWGTTQFLFTATAAATQSPYYAVYFRPSDDKFVLQSLKGAPGAGDNIVVSINSYLNDFDWHMFQCLLSSNGQITAFYIDNVNQGSDTSTSPDLSTVDVFDIGVWETTPNILPWDGDADLCRVSNIQRSADWLTINYNAQSDNSTFLTIGSEEELDLPDYLPVLTKAPAEPLGTWRIEYVSAGTRASFGLKELRAGVNAKLPNNVFNEEDYPDADGSIYGSPIPIYTGPVRGMLAYKIDTTTDTFKFADNPSASSQGIVDGDGASVTPTSTDLANSEFVWTGHTDETLYVSATSVNPNPVDAMKFLYTDPDYGTNIPLAKLDTTSTGKGYGTTGARVNFIYGHSANGAVEHNTVNIGIYINEVRKVSDIIKEIKNAAMLTAYTATGGLFQVKAFSPARSEGLLEITKDHVPTGFKVVPQINTADAVTKCRVFYNKDHRTGAEQVYEFESDELKWRRGLDSHAVKDLHLPIADLRGATMRAQREVVFEGEPRWTLPIKVTQEFSQLEPSDYVKLNYQPVDENGKATGLGIRTVCEVVRKTYAGGIEVDLVLRDIRGLRDRVGWYTDTTINFPASLGGDPITTWDATWTYAQKRWVRENLAFYHDADGYCETLSATDDAFFSHHATVYI